MMKLFDFLYYSFYCLVIKKKNETGEERASFMLAGSTSTFIIAFYFLLSIINKGNLLDPRMLFFIGVLIYVVNGWLTYRYFVRSGRFQVIVNEYSKKTKSKKRLYAIIALTIFVGSFVLFALVGYNFSRLVLG